MKKIKNFTLLINLKIIFDNDKNVFIFMRNYGIIIMLNKYKNSK